MTLDPDTADLLAAVIDLNGRLHDADERERSTALGYLAGLLRGVGRGTTSLSAATTVLGAYRPGHVEEAADARA